jgi:isocitrate/isopropylmalate dehydrogenase
MTKKIALVTGDGSAPEMMAQAVRIVTHAARRDDVKIEFVETPMGWNAYEKFGDTTPEKSMETAVNLGFVFFGGVGDPKFDKTIGAEKPEMMPEARALLALRKKMGLLLNFRPMILMRELAHLSPLRPELIPEEGVNMTFIRFLLEDSYFGTQDLGPDFWSTTASVTENLGLKLKKDVTGNEKMITELAYYRGETIEKYFRMAFSYARNMGLPLTSVDKANVMARYAYWQKIVDRVAKDFPEVPYRHQLAMRPDLILNIKSVMENKQSALALKYFLDNFPLDMMIDKVKPISKKEELAYLYFGRLSEVLGVFDRLIRYEKYFKDFIPHVESGISESEAIEYHLRSYIEDFYILQERIRKIVFHLIEDIPNYGIQNPKDAEKALRHLFDQIYKKFEKITSGLRREHVHERSISELDLVTGKFLSSIISGAMPIPIGMQPDLNLLKIKHNEVLNSTKEKHIQQSQKNSASLRKMKEWFSARFAYIFSSLNEHTIDGLNMDSE